MIKSKKLKIPLVALLFAISLIVCTVIRYSQYASVIWPDDGFFKFNGGFLNNAYYIFFAIAVVGFFVLAYFDKKVERGIIREKSTGLMLSPVSSFLGAFITAVCGFLLAYDAINAYLGKAPFIQYFTLAIAAIGYTFIGYSVFTHRKIVPFTALAFLFVSACYICIAAMLFMQRIYILNLSAMLIMLAVYLLMAVFFLSCGRIVVRSETRYTTVFCTVCGYSAVLLLISDSVARTLYYFTCGSETQDILNINAQTNGFELPTPLLILQGIAVLWFLFALSYKNQNIGHEMPNPFEGELDVPKDEINNENNEKNEKLQCGEDFTSSDNNVPPAI